MNKQRCQPCVERKLRRMIRERDVRIKELEAQRNQMMMNMDEWITRCLAAEAKVERLEKAATESAAELRMQLQHGCPHLAGDLCIKEGACECYGSTGG